MVDVWLCGCMCAGVSCWCMTRLRTVAYWGGNTSTGQVSGDTSTHTMHTDKHETDDHSKGCSIPQRLTPSSQYMYNEEDAVQPLSSQVLLTDASSLRRNALTLTPCATVGCVVRC